MLAQRSSSGADEGGPGDGGSHLTNGSCWQPLLAASAPRATLTGRRARAGRRLLWKRLQQSRGRYTVWESGGRGAGCRSLLFPRDFMLSVRGRVVHAAVVAVW